MKITLDKNLRELRLAAGMTQEELAESLSVSPQTVSRWETGGSFLLISKDFYSTASSGGFLR